jgi:hypothetical protein
MPDYNRANLLEKEQREEFQFSPKSKSGLLD